VTADVQAPAIDVRRSAPNASDEEVAAIVAALQLVWSRPQAAVIADPPMRWRFSGRWWSKPVPSRRDRPG
jgi:hypothetical protein